MGDGGPVAAELGGGDRDALGVSVKEEGRSDVGNEVGEEEE